MVALNSSRLPPRQQAHSGSTHKPFSTLEPRYSALARDPLKLKDGSVLTPHTLPTVNGDTDVMALISIFQTILQEAKKKKNTKKEMK